MTKEAHQEFIRHLRAELKYSDFFSIIIGSVGDAPTGFTLNQ